MFMCKEASNFTMLRLTSDNFAEAVDTLKSLIDERGELLSIEYVHGEDAYEIWLRDRETKEAFVYMLFPASWMLVEIQKGDKNDEYDNLCFSRASRAGHSAG